MAKKVVIPAAIFIGINSKQIYLKLSPHPLPLPSGERGRVRGHKMLEENSQI
jgi:hypothetical protein